MSMGGGRSREDSRNGGGDTTSVLTKKNLNTLSDGDKGGYLRNRDDDTISHRSGSTRIPGSLTHTFNANPATTLDAHRSMQAFL